MSVVLTGLPSLTATEVPKRAVLHTLAYSDVFDYPLTAAEVHRYLTVPASMQDVECELRELAAQGSVIEQDRFHALRGRERIFAVRERRTVAAASLWQHALRYGGAVASIPFVRMVAITGSLALWNTEPGTDVDLFVVCEPGRLWTCRALVLALARMAILDGVTLCPNYIVTTRALEFQERSLYVAHEVAQMIPISGLDVYDRIRRINGWTDDYLPNARSMPVGSRNQRAGVRRQALAERLLRGLPTQWFEAWEMERKIRRLSQEQAASGEAQFSADVCKGHADRHRHLTESKLQQRLEALP